MASPDFSVAPDMAMKPAPTISTITPASATTAGGGMLQITGTGFQMGATVTVGGTACSNPTVTDTTISCTIPAKAMGCGAAAVVVTNPDTQSVTAGTGFSYRTAMVGYANAVNTMTSGTFPRRVVAADLNGDMKPDLITANINSSNFSVFLNNGMGGFPNAPTNRNTGGATNVNDVAVGDVNGDGKLDVVTTNNGSSNITLYLGNGDGTFGNGANFAAGAAPGSIALADLNNDNKLDVAVGSTGAGTVNVLLANATGTGFMGLTAVAVVGSTNIGDVALVDLDGNNKPDLIVTSRNQNNISVFNGNGGTAFANLATFGTVGTNPFGLYVADVDGNGKLDVVTANTNTNNVSVLRGNGDRTFQAATTFGTANTPESVFVADMNKDGIPDILTSNAGTNNFSYLQGMGNNTYAATANRATGTNATGLWVADLNGDTLDDVAVTSGAMNNVGVHLQQCQ